MSMGHVDPSWLGTPADLTSDEPGDACAFCQIVTGDAPADVIAETDAVVCFLDRLPATYGHTLVVPKAHTVDLFDIDDASYRAVMDAARDVAHALRRACLASGVNLVHASGSAAHQTVFHFHVHVVPRYDGDSIVVFPRLADPSERASVADRLRADFETAGPMTGTGGAR